MNQNGYDEGMDITVHTGDNENTSYHNVEIIVFMKATLMLYRNWNNKQAEASLFDDNVLVGW